GFEMTGGPVRAGGPPQKQQGGAVPALGVGGRVHERRDGVGQPIRRAERGGTLVDPLIATERRVVAQRRRRDSRTTLPTMNAMLAGGCSLSQRGPACSIQTASLTIRDKTCRGGGPGPAGSRTG